MSLSWIEISEKALQHNLKAFRNLVGKNTILAPAVKANAYGHGLVETSKILAKSGADFLCINAAYEAEMLRESGIMLPLLIIGYTPLNDLKKALELNCDLTVYNPETIQALGKIGKSANLHLKIETGNHRQGVRPEDLPLVLGVLKKHEHLKLVGLSTHFADIEDRINHHYALFQLKEFERARKILEENGRAPHFIHAANTAATILLPEARFNFVRVGIGTYGLWPSEKTMQASGHAGMNLKLIPALTWKTIVAQVKDVKRGDLIGYGCTYEMAKDGRIAVLPVGYYDGYVRLLSNKASVLIKGQRAPIVGRVCMNMIMVDISHIPDVRLEEEVILIGKQGKEEITADELATLSQTINYEVTTRINERIERRISKVEKSITEDSWTVE